MTRRSHGVAREREQFEHALAYGGALISGKHGEEIEKARERVLDVSAREVEIGDGQLGLDVCGSGGSRGAGRLQVGALDTVEQPHLAESRPCVGIARVLGERGFVGGDRRGLSPPPRSRHTASACSGRAEGSSASAGPSTEDPPDACTEPVTPF